MRKLIPAICMLLIAASMLGASTYAWFSMNTKVTVTGMEVYTQVPSNLYVAPVDGENGKTNTTFTATAGTAFSTQLISTLDAALLEPISTVDGINFFYTDSKKVKASGNTYDHDTFFAYEAAGFNASYGTTGAVPYVDYVVMLQATNTESTEKTVDLTEVNLTYGGDTAGNADKAFRVAIFVQDAGTNATPVTGTVNVTGDAVVDNTTGNRTTPVLVSILTPGSTYFDAGKAVAAESGEGAIAEVNQLGEATNIGTVAANETRYFKVTARLWLEGEDSNCNNSTFAQLNEKWALDLAFKFDGEAATAITAVDNTFSVALGTTADEEDGAPVSQFVGDTEYFKYTVGSESDEYWANASTVAAGTKFYTIDGNEVYDVTNQVVITVNYTVTAENATTTKATSTTVDVNKDLVVKFNADAGYELPDTVDVTIGGAEGTSTWDKATGTLTIAKANLTGDVVVTVEPTEA